MQNPSNIANMSDLVREILLVRALCSSRPLGPSCRSAISKDRLFDRAIFEPTNAELFPKQTTVVFKSKQRAAAKNKGKAKAQVNDDDDIVMDTDDEVEQAFREDEDDEHNGDMSDFIVDDDDDDADYKDRRSSRKGPKSKPVHGSRRKPFVVLESDDEEDEPEIKEVVFGKKKKEELTPEALQYRFLASTKMKHMMSHIMKLFEEKPDEKVRLTLCLKHRAFVSYVSVRSLSFLNGQVAST